jgi:hypothetical protein
MKTVSTFLVSLLITYSTPDSRCLPADQFLAAVLQKHNIVGLDEGPHGTVEVHAYIRQLINSKGMDAVDFIILEFLNTSCQQIVDDYIDGENVSVTSLKTAWRSGSQAHNPGYGEAPVFTQLLETIRSVNAQRGAGHKLRVLCGDPPFNWNKITTQKEYFQSLSQRDVFPAQLAIEYGIKLNKKVLLIYGGRHFAKIADSNADSTHWPIDYLVNSKYPDAFYTIALLSSKENRPVPLYTMCSFTNDHADPDVFIQLPNGKAISINKLYDAYFYVGPSDNWTTDSARGFERAYWLELNRRSKLVWGEGIDSSFIKN